MNDALYEHIKNQTLLQRIVTAFLYPIMNLFALYAAVLFFSLVDVSGAQNKG